jgi:hypothetical protein
VLLEGTFVDPMILKTLVTSPTRPSRDEQTFFLSLNLSGWQPLGGKRCSLHHVPITLTLETLRVALGWRVQSAFYVSLLLAYTWELLLVD